MRRNDLNFFVDTAALAALLFLLSTGIINRFVLPPGSGRSLTLWGMDRHGWGGIHFWAAAIFVLLMAVHLVLHWSWISCMIFGRPAEGSSRRGKSDPRIAVALVLLFLAALLALAPFFGNVKGTGGGSRGEQDGRGGGYGRLEREERR